MPRVQVCSKCGARRKGHPLPVGATECKQEPLSPHKRARVIEGVYQADIEIITEDDAVPESSDAMRQDMERIRKEKEELKKQAEKVKEGLKQAEEQQLAMEWKEMKEELDKMHQLVEGQQAQLVNMQTKIQEFENKDRGDKDNSATNNPLEPGQPHSSQPVPVIQQQQPAAGKSQVIYVMSNQGQLVPVQVPCSPAVPSAAPGSSVIPGASPAPLGQVQSVPVSPSPGLGQPSVFKVPVAPAPRTPSTPLDPSHLVYANAIAGQYAQSPISSGNAAQGAVGLDPARVFTENPQLAAACGIASTHNESEQGKCLAEQYIYKPQYKTVEKPSYYEFMHGALRMMKTRLLQDHLPIDDFITYYEYIACLATQFRWHSVYDVHASHVGEIENKRKKWSDPVDTNLKEKYCNAGSHLPDKETRPTRRDIPRGSRDHRRGGGLGDRDSDRDHYVKSRSASASTSSAWKPTCDLFNRNPYSCTFDPCRYRHVCSECEVRGITAPHSKAFCELANPSSGRSYSQPGQNNAQAGPTNR